MGSYFLENQCGLTVRYQIPNSKEIMIIYDGDRVPLSFSSKNNDPKFHRKERSKNQSLSFKVDEFGVVKNFGLEVIGKHVIFLAKEKTMITNVTLSHLSLFFSFLVPLCRFNSRRGVR